MREPAYSNVARSEEEEQKPLRDDSSADHDALDRELYELKRQLRRTNLYLRIVLGVIGAAAASFFVLQLGRIVQAARIPAASVYRPLIKTPVPPRTLHISVQMPAAELT